MQTIKLLFDVTTLTGSLGKAISRTGIYFASYNIFRCMLERKDFEITLLTNRPRLLAKYLAREFPGRTDFRIADSLENLSGYDAFFSPAEPNGYRVKETLPAVSCYSLLYDIVPIVHPEFFRDSQYPAMWDILHRAKYEDHMFAISQNTKDDVVRMLDDTGPERITVVPLGANEHFYRNTSPADFAAAGRKYKIPQDKRYILSLCTKEPRKNLLTAVEAFLEFVDSENIEDLVFVLAGGTWDIFKSAWSKYERHAGKILSIGYVDDKDVAVLYSNALWFVYTSRYEGFGLPPLEAMQCGCPVVTANNSSLPEVVGDSALMVDSPSVVQHVSAFRRYYSEPALREEYSRKGIDRAKLFSWQSCADIICERIRGDMERKRAVSETTVIVPVGFAELPVSGDEALKRIESAAEQKYGPKRIAVLDGGADAGLSADLARRAGCGGLTVTSCAGKSMYGSLNDVLPDIGTEYVSFLLPGMRYSDAGYLSVCIAKANETGADTVYGSCLVRAGSGASFRTGSAENLATGDLFSPGAAVMRLDAISAAGGFSPEFGPAAFDELIMRMVRSGRTFAEVTGVQTEQDTAASGVRDNEAYSRAFMSVFGAEAGLTPEEALTLAGDGYLKTCSDKRAMEIAGKLPPEAGGMAVLARLVRARWLSAILEENRARTMNGSNFRLFGFIPLKVTHTGSAISSTTTFRLGKVLPLLRIRRHERSRTSFYLFGFLPLLRIKSRN